MSIAIPRLSATVLLLSQNAPSLRAASLATAISVGKAKEPVQPIKNNENREMSDFKVLMVRRHGKARFMPNKYVFPGGSVEESDVQRANVLHVPVQRLIALRELSEETNCVLRSNGSLCSSNDWQKEKERLMESENRESSNSNGDDYKKMLCCDYDVEAASRLTLLARWITPPAYPYRYDTYFYGAIVDNNYDKKEELVDKSCAECTHAQEITLRHQAKELTEAKWYAPLDILRKHEGMCIDHTNCSVAPITYFMLHALAQYPSLQEIANLWSERTRNCNSSTTIDGNRNVNVDEESIHAVISEEDTPDAQYINEKLNTETRMRIPANYIVHLSSKALLPPGRYNIVKECVNGLQRITHLTIGEANTSERSDNYNFVNEEVVLRH